MAGSKSLYLANALLNHVLGKTTYTAPTNMYVGLWTSALDDNSDGDTTGEVSGGSYARVAIANNTTTFGTASTDGTQTNAIAITFPTATGTWGTISHVGFFDATTSGNLLYWTQLSVSKTVTNGDTLKFDVDDVVFTET